MALSVGRSLSTSTEITAETARLRTGLHSWLRGAEWPTRVILTARIGPDTDSDWSPYPVYLSAPYFPSSSKNEIMELEYEHEPLNAVRRWITSEDYALYRLDVLKESGSSIDDMAERLGT
jgi:hypothetical protein